MVELVGIEPTTSSLRTITSSVANLLIALALSPLLLLFRPQLLEA